MANPNGYIQGADGTPLELVDATARRQLAGKLDAPGGVKVGDYLRVKSVGEDGTVVVEGAERPGADSGQNPSNADVSNIKTVLANMMTIIKAQVEDANGTPQGYNMDVSGLVAQNNALITALGSFGDSGDDPEKTLTSISATYSGGSVPVGTAVIALTGIVVTAHYSDGSAAVVTGYTLSGTIIEGSNAITVSYGGMTTAITVVGVAQDSGGEGGGATGDALPTDGLMAYFDLRNLGDKANVTVGTAKGVVATQGNGALYSWASQPITSSDGYGVKVDRGMMFSAESNTTQTNLGTEFTVISFGYGECIGPGIDATNISPRWKLRPKYNKADGTANVPDIAATELNADNMEDYNYAVYRVSGANLTIVNDTSRKDYNGNDYEGFVSWESLPTVGRTSFGSGYGTAVAIYNRAVSDVEIEEAREFMRTLEVTA